jgi:superfamily I DNA/RNA helicase
MNWFNIVGEHLLKLAAFGGKGYAPQVPFAKYYDLGGQKVLGVGNSFAIKDQLKAIGFRYNPDNRDWYIPANAPKFNSALDVLKKLNIIIPSENISKPIETGTNVEVSDSPNNGSGVVPEVNKATPAPIPVAFGGFTLTSTGNVRPNNRIQYLKRNIVVLLEQLGFRESYGFLILQPKAFVNKVKDPNNSFIVNDLKNLGYDCNIMAKHIDPTFVPLENIESENKTDSEKREPVQANAFYFIGVDRLKHTPVICRSLGDSISFEDLEGKVKSRLSTEEFSKTYDIVKNRNGTRIESPDLEDMKSYAKSYTLTEDRLKELRVKNSFSDDKLNDEGKALDNKFKDLMGDEDQSHIMIGALSGAGKTSSLKSLAWKYGKPGESWLYLVFNKKNQVEGTEKFPPWVTVKTTNGFLGNILDKWNSGSDAVQSTERMVSIQNKSKSNKENSKIPEKSRVISDSPQFTNTLAALGIKNLSWEESKKWNVSEKKRYGTAAYNFIKGKIIYTIKDEVVKLSELCKAYAVDPRDADLDQQIKKVADLYDIDFNLGDVKEKLSQYKSPYKDELLYIIDEFFGFKFMNKDFTSEILTCTAWVLKHSLPGVADSYYTHDDNSKHKLGDYRDFSDDLWYTAINSKKLKWPHYDYVMADEVQDFNECQSIMLQRLHDAGAKIIAVGDVNQSIYRFRGSDSTSFNKVATHLEALSKNKDINATLSRNFRSRKNIIDFVNKNTKVKNLLQGREYDDGNDGEVTTGKIAEPEMMTGLATEFKSGKMPQTAILSRTNEPLAEAAMGLLGAGVPFVIIGKDIARDLINHVMSIVRMLGYSKDINEKMANTDLNSFVNKMNEYADKENNMYGNKNAKKAYLQELNGRTEALEKCVAQFNKDTDALNVTNNTGAEELDPELKDADPSSGKNVATFVKWLRSKLTGLNPDENEKDLELYKKQMASDRPPVALTTAHRSKGLEWSRVFLMRPELFPHPNSTRPEDLEQEENAKYVAYTRAMDTLHILKPKEVDS